MNKAVILDRDGTLIFDSGYVYRVEDFKLLPGVIEGLKSLSKQFIFIIITNQSGIGRGLLPYPFSMLLFNSSKLTVDVPIFPTVIPAA